MEKRYEQLDVIIIDNLRDIIVTGSIGKEIFTLQEEPDRFQPKLDVAYTMLA